MLQWELMFALIVYIDTRNETVFLTKLLFINLIVDNQKEDCYRLIHLRRPPVWHRTGCRLTRFPTNLEQYP